MMQEQLLHYIWQQRLFSALPQQTTDGRTVEVIDPGQLNRDSGPDFFNAKVKIDGVYWAGNVEIHTKASDWYHHGHQNDTAYDNIILHVVADSDMDVTSSDGRLIPQMQLRYPQPINGLYEKWCADKGLIACRERVAQLPKVLIHNWLEALAVERLDAKAKAIEQMAHENGEDVEQVFYVMLARAFGFHTNSTPFELTARSLPLKVIERHRGSKTQVEALLFGQASLLKNVDDYSRKLTTEYEFLSHKFGLEPIDAKLWKWMRMRPSSFPTIRMAQFAQLVFKHERLMGLLTENSDSESVKQVLGVDAGDYWDSRYTFGDAQSEKRTKRVGEKSVNSLIINVVAPFVYYKGMKLDDPDFAARALDMLSNIEPEENSVIQQWKSCGVVPQNALDTQALLQLAENYCRAHGCLRCRLAYNMLKKA